MEFLWKSGQSPNLGSPDDMGIDDVRELFGTSHIPGSSQDLEVLVNWTRSLAQKKGEAYIRKNRKRLFRDWKNILKMGMSRI
jgi:hypothetical protein